MEGEDTNREQFFLRAERALAKIDSYTLNRLLTRAYQLAKMAHRNQERRDGARYVTHPRAVAEILMDFGPVTLEEVLIALLHDVLEDGWVLPDMLEEWFGPHVTWGVVVLTKYDITLKAHGTIVKTKLGPERYFPRLAGAESYVQRPKFGDRIHNLRTMGPMGMDHQRKQVEETRKYILPIARVTDERMAVELERLCQEWESSWTEAF